MTRQKVIDPALLAQLGESPRQKVTDPDLLAQLNGEEEDEGEYLDNLPGPEGFWHKMPRNIVTGLANLGHTTLNYPHDIAQNLENQGETFGKSINENFPLPEEVQKKLDSMPKHERFKLSEHIPKQEEYDFAQMLGQKGRGTLMDRIIQKSVEHSPDIALGTSLLKKGINRYLLPDMLASKKYGPLKNKVGQLEEETHAARETHGANEEQYNALKEFLERQPGFETSNPNALIRKAEEAGLKINELKALSEKTPEHLRAIEEPMLPEKTPLSIVEPVQAEFTETTKFPKTEVNENMLREAEQSHSKGQEATQTSKEKIEEHLGKGNAHNKRVATILNPILEKRQAEIGKGYNEYIENLKGKQVTLSNPRDAKAITSELNKKIQEGGFESKDVQGLAKELAELSESKEVMPADKFVAAYRSLRGMAQKTRSSAYGKSPQEFDRLIEAADSMDADVSRMSKIIDEGLGKDNLKELHALNHRYATEVAPLFKNKFYQYMQANNKAPANMIEQLQKEPFIKSTNPNKVTGAHILHGIIKEHPDLLKNIIGERFADRPELLHQWDEAAHEYIQHMPELQQHRQTHFEARQAENEAKQHLEHAQELHRAEKAEAKAHDLELQKSHEKEVKEKNEKSALEAKEKTRLKKSEVDKENKQKQREYHAKKQHHETIKKLEDLDKRHKSLTENAKKMEALAKNKKISLKTKIETESNLKKYKSELAEVEKQRKIYHRKLYALGGIAVTAALGGPVVHKIKSLAGL